MLLGRNSVESSQYVRESGRRVFADESMRFTFVNSAIFEQLGASITVGRACSNQARLGASWEGSIGRATAGDGSTIAGAGA